MYVYVLDFTYFVVIIDTKTTSKYIISTFLLGGYPQ